MEILAIVVMVALALLAAFFFQENHKLNQRIVSMDEQLREAQHAKSKPSKPAKSEKSDQRAATTDPELERDLDDARNEIKDLKKQIYDLKSESKGLKQELKSATDRSSSAPDSEMIFELREQIAELSTENARLEDALEEARSRRSAPQSEPKPEEKKPEPPPAAAASTTAGPDTESLRAKYDKELDGLRDEVRDLNRKLKSTASNVDKQRRRADNNDRAYKITQRQYDAAQERVALLEAQLEKAGVKPVPVAELQARTPEVSSEPAKRTPAAIAADEAAAEAERAAAEEAAKEAAAQKPSPPKPPATPTPAQEESAPPPTPGAMVRKQAPKPEVGSTTVLSPMALASAAKAESDEEAEEDSGTTVHHAKPITAADLSSPEDEEHDSGERQSAGRTEMLTPVVPAVQQSEPAADESGGHTAMLTPAALAKSAPPAEEQSEPAADESGGHTAVLSPANLSAAVSGEQKSEAHSEASEAEDTRERTAIMSGAALAPRSEGHDEPEASDEVAKADEEPDGGRRPSSGLFGMPADAMKRPADEEEDPIRSTQFAFPTQMVTEDDDGDTDGTQRFAPVSGSELKPSRLGGGVSGDNPADKPVPDADEEQKGDKRLGGGGRLGDLDLGDIGSAIDDAWGDLDVD